MLGAIATASSARRASGAALRRGDGWLLAATIALLGLSLLMVLSTTALTAQELHGDPTTIIRKHLAHIFLGICGLFVFARLNPLRLAGKGNYFLALAVVMLGFVLVPAIGEIAGGARRWVSVAGIRLQPGEIVKLCLVIFFADYIARNRERLGEFVPGVVIPFAITSVVAALLLLQPDFGSSVVIMLIVLCQLLVGGARLLHLALVGLAAAGAAAILVISSPYRFGRLVAFLDPFADPSKSGYQLIQSLIAVGSGGTWGLGLGAGKQKLFYLPAAHTDFIFAVIAEELGLFGALGVLTLFALIAYRGVLLARRLYDEPFLCALTTGLTLLIVIPAILNICVVTGLLPTKGMVLPLVGYGGTAMVMNLSLMGLLLALTKIGGR